MTTPTRPLRCACRGFLLNVGTELQCDSCGTSSGQRPPRPSSPDLPRKLLLRTLSRIELTVTKLSLAY